MYFKPKWLKNHNPFGADIAHIRECPLSHSHLNSLTTVASYILLKTYNNILFFIIMLNILWN